MELEGNGTQAATSSVANYIMSSLVYWTVMVGFDLIVLLLSSSSAT